MDFEKLGGTRFILSVITSISASILLVLGHLDGPTYSLIILGTIGAYIAADTTQNIKNITSGVDK